jgi:hypothetical protein
MTYKFRIKELLENLTKHEYTIAMKELPVMLGLHPVTFSRLINTKLDSSYEPASETMLKIALFFSINVEDLYTNPPQVLSFKNLNASIEKELNLTT